MYIGCADKDSEFLDEFTFELRALNWVPLEFWVEKNAPVHNSKTFNISSWSSWAEYFGFDPIYACLYSSTLIIIIMKLKNILRVEKWSSNNNNNNSRYAKKIVFGFPLSPCVYFTTIKYICGEYLCLPHRETSFEIPM